MLGCEDAFPQVEDRPAPVPPEPDPVPSDGWLDLAGGAIASSWDIGVDYVSAISECPAAVAGRVAAEAAGATQRIVSDAAGGTAAMVGDAVRNLGQIGQGILAQAGTTPAAAAGRAVASVVEATLVKPAQFASNVEAIIGLCCALSD